MNMPIVMISLLRSVWICSTFRRLSMPISTHFYFAMWSTTTTTTTWLLLLLFWLLLWATAAMWDNRILHDKSRRPLRSSCINCSTNQQHKLAVNRSWMASEHHICRVWHSWNSRDELLLLSTFFRCYKCKHHFTVRRQKNTTIWWVYAAVYRCSRRSKNRNAIDKIQTTNARINIRCIVSSSATSNSNNFCCYFFCSLFERQESEKAIER